MPSTLSSRPFGMPTDYNPYGDALMSYGTGMPSYMGLPGGSSSMGSGASGPGLTDGLLSSGLLGGGIAAAGTFLSNLFAMKNANKQRELDRQQQLNMQSSNNQLTRDQSQQSLAFNESQLDPFRQQMAQAGDLNKLDRLERSSYAPVKLNVGNSPYAKYVPQSTGGYSYSKSPELVQSAAALKKSVMAGNGAPSMTNPSNYGKSSALDLVSILAGSKDPTSKSAYATGPSYDPSSINVPGGANVRATYLSELGRDPTDAEVLSQTGNGTFQSYDPRLGNSLDNIRNSIEARRRRGVMPPPTAGDPYMPSYANVQ